MSHRPEANVDVDVDDEIDFKWGKKRGVGLNNKDVQFYESFTHRGMEYFLYDCAYFYQEDDVETSIGKIMKIYETPTHGKKVKVVWLFRPFDIRNFLGDYQPHWKELFLACGEGYGVSNVFPLESIIEKCSVVCTSKDKRNFKPSEAELKMADYFFNLLFDVQRCEIVEKFPDEIGGFTVEQFFNRKKVQKTSNLISRPRVVIKKRNGPSGLSQCQVEDKAQERPQNAMPKDTPLNPFPYKKRKIVEDNLSRSKGKELKRKEDFEENGRKEFHKVAPQLKLDKEVKNCGEFMGFTRRPGDEKRKWFKQLPWEDRLRRAQELGSLILLNNLDPSYTSYEVEDLIWHTLNERVEARMIEWSPTFNPHYGRALVIFKTKDAAESALSQLSKRCLILGDGRVVSATRGTITEPAEKTNFIGHLVFERFGSQRQREEMKKAVSTSHCAQSNTIEYTMASEWCLLQRKSDACCNALFQKQMEEIQDVKSRLKKDCNT